MVAVMKDESKEFENELMIQVKEAFDLLNEIGAERDELNAKKKAAISALQAKGIDKDVLTWCYKYREADEEKRKVMDLSLMLIRKAIGQPLQLDLLQETNAAINLNEMVKPKDDNGIVVIFGGHDE